MRWARLAAASQAVLVAAVSAGAEAPKESGEQLRPPAIGKALIGYWDFDEPVGGQCRDVSGGGLDAAPDRPTAGLIRTPGVFGGAMGFTGRHMLRLTARPKLAGLKAISLTAWVRPTRFERYNEIFRKEDGDRRVLFSFQEHARILSLGLNVGGYVECDARLDPKAVLDGGWHHCAATFDGKTIVPQISNR